MVYYHKVLRDCKIFLINLDMLLYLNSKTEIFIYQENLDKFDNVVITLIKDYLIFYIYSRNEGKFNTSLLH